MSSKQEFSRIGIIAILIACLAFLIVFLDLLLLTPRSWPYVDGGGWESITLYQSSFWIQYIYHCQYLKPTAFGLIIWKYWVILLAFGLSQQVIPSQDFNENNNQNILGIRKDPSKGWKLVLVANFTLLLLFAIRFRRLFGSRLVNPLFDPIIFLISALAFVIFPIITFLLTFKGIRSESPLPALGLFGWIPLEGISSTLFLNFLLWGCE